MNKEKGQSPKIENIVASGSVADSIDLEMLSAKIDSCDLNKKRFPGAVLRLQDPKIAVLVFSSGKVVLTGAKSPEDLVRGQKVLIQKMKEAGVICHDKPSVAITNMVCSYDLKKYINLNKVVITLNVENIEYEPEQFPGLVYRIADPKIVVLIFSSGKIILTGGKTMENVERGVVFLEQMLKQI
ncbi:MAG: TATA-box-binding protein [Methanomicrobiales archaeon HGW-Methanomicrobiales-1]|jgi:transcription initiation factor TFIID TATA-box-binding protein|nr:MAG: TATA-box-binding protein [Methanomicrobiales archaeon HGW-Methanomicrobiales-1]